MVSINFRDCHSVVEFGHVSGCREVPLHQPLIGLLNPTIKARGYRLPVTAGLPGTLNLKHGVHRLPHVKHLARME